MKKYLKMPLFWSTVILGGTTILLTATTANVATKLESIENAVNAQGKYFDYEENEFYYLDGYEEDDDETESSSSSSYSSSSSSTSSSSTTTSSSSEPFDPAQYETIDYNAWNHDDIEKAKKIQISGKVLQVSNQDGDRLLRIAINDNYDQVALALINERDYEKVIAEDDQITIYGFNSGLTSYETIFGADKTLPAMLATKYEVSY